MNMLKALVAVGVGAAAVVGLASAASATDGSLSKNQDCTGISITVQSHWDGGTIHVTVESPARGQFDVPPLGTKTFHESWDGANEIATYVSSSNGLLNQQPAGFVFKFVFKKSDTCTPATSPPPTPMPTMPPGPSAPTTVVSPTTTQKLCEDGKPPSIPVEDGSLVCPEFGAPPAPTTTTTASATAIVRTGPPATHATPAVALPATGMNPWVKALIGLAAAVAGSMCVLVTRRRTA